MEFFAQLEKTNLTPDNLKLSLTIASLADYNQSIDKVIEDQQIHGVIYCIWGEFQVNREELLEGVRFTMPACPNALQWSITVDSGGLLTVYCSINKQQHDEDFIESIKVFVQDQLNGVKQLLD